MKNLTTVKTVQGVFVMKKRNVFAAPVLVLALVLAACGSTGPSKAALEYMPDWILLNMKQRAERADDRVMQELIETEYARREAERLATERRAAEEKKAAEERQAAIDAANAKGVSAEDFDYDVTRNGTGIVITRYKGMATIVTIPATIEGLPVKELGTHGTVRFSDDPFVQTSSVFSGNTQNSQRYVPRQPYRYSGRAKKMTLHQGRHIWSVWRF
jgi:hypothetical protein